MMALCSESEIEKCNFHPTWKIDESLNACTFKDLKARMQYADDVTQPTLKVEGLLFKSYLLMSKFNAEEETESAKSNLKRAIDILNGWKESPEKDGCLSIAFLLEGWIDKGTEEEKVKVVKKLQSENKDPSRLYRFEAVTHYIKGQALSRLGFSRLLECIDEFRQAKEKYQKKPEYSFSFVHTTILFHDPKEHDEQKELIRILETVLKEDKRHLHAMVQLAGLQQLKGNKDGATQLLTTFTEFLKEDHHTRYTHDVMNIMIHAMEIYILLEDYKKADEIFDMANMSPSRTDPSNTNLSETDQSSNNMRDTTKSDKDSLNTNVSNSDSTPTNNGATNIGATNPSATNNGATNIGATNIDATNPSAMNIDATDPSATNNGATNIGATNIDATNPSATNIDEMNPSVTNPNNTKSRNGSQTNSNPRNLNSSDANSSKQTFSNNNPRTTDTSNVSKPISNTDNSNINPGITTTNANATNANSDANPSNRLTKNTNSDNPKDTRNSNPEDRQVNKNNVTGINMNTSKANPDNPNATNSISGKLNSSKLDTGTGNKNPQNTKTNGTNPSKTDTSDKTNPGNTNRGSINLNSLNPGNTATSNTEADNPDTSNTDKTNLGNTNRGSINLNSLNPANTATSNTATSNIKADNPDTSNTDKTNPGNTNRDSINLNSLNPGNTATSNMNLYKDSSRRCSRCYSVLLYQKAMVEKNRGNFEDCKKYTKDAIKVDSLNLNAELALAEQDAGDESCDKVTEYYQKIIHNHRHDNAALVKIYSNYGDTLWRIDKDKAQKQYWVALKQAFRYCRISPNPNTSSQRKTFYNNVKSDVNHCVVRLRSQLKTDLEDIQSVLAIVDLEYMLSNLYLTHTYCKSALKLENLDSSSKLQIIKTLVEVNIEIANDVEELSECNACMEELKSLSEDEHSKLTVKLAIKKGMLISNRDSVNSCKEYDAATRLHSLQGAHLLLTELQRLNKKSFVFYQSCARVDTFINKHLKDNDERDVMQSQLDKVLTRELAGDLRYLRERQLGMEKALMSDKNPMDDVDKVIQKACKLLNRAMRRLKHTYCKGTTKKSKGLNADFFYISSTYAPDIRSTKEKVKYQLEIENKWSDVDAGLIEFLTKIQPREHPKEYNNIIAVIEFNNREKHDDTGNRKTHGTFEVYKDGWETESKTFDYVDLARWICDEIPYLLDNLNGYSSQLQL